MCLMKCKCDKIVFTMQRLKWNGEGSETVKEEKQKGRDERDWRRRGNEEIPFQYKNGTGSYVCGSYECTNT